MAKKLTIGMATYDDMNGTIFTVQDLRQTILEFGFEDEVEIVIVDNNPQSDHGGRIRSFLRDESKVETNYYTFEVDGTSQSRNFVFKQAKGEYVMCMDCHVTLKRGALLYLMEQIVQGNLGDNIYHGPLWYNGLQKTSDVFDPVWRSEMWGIWGSVWVKADNSFHGPYVLPRENEGQVDLLLVEGDMLNMRVHEKQFCPWIRHEDYMEHHGYVKAADRPEPYAIPAQGLGMFMAKKDSWLGFNEHFRGFGGEEVYIHEKYRKAGRKAI